MTNPYDISRLLEGVDDCEKERRQEDGCETSVVTKDSIERKKNAKASGGTSKTTKKGGKKKSSSSSTGLGGGSSLDLKSSSGGGGGPTLSLGAALQKVAGPSLERKDYGRGLDDNDTFCGMGTVGEQELAKSTNNAKSNESPKKVKTIKRSQIPPPKMAPAPAAALPKKSMFSTSNKDDDDEDDDDDDFFQFDNNPFKMPSNLR